MSKIFFKNNGVSPGLKHRQELKQFLASIFFEEGVEFELVYYIFSTDEALLKLNRQFLNHDTLTDIITFTLSGMHNPILSEIYISIERVKENALLFEIPFLEELHRVIIHGILHLCGYSDHGPRLKANMRKKEDYYLSQIDFM